MEHYYPGFTPVRRREQEFDSFSPVGLKASWTAARCNRLLRPLTSRIELLKKHIGHSGTKNSTEVQSKPRKEQSSVQNHMQVRKRTRQEAEGKSQAYASGNLADGEWAVRKYARRKCQHTYSARATQQSRHAIEGRAGARQGGLRSTVPGQVVLATPVLVRAHSSALVTGSTSQGSDQSRLQGTGFNFLGAKNPQKRIPAQRSGKTKAGLDACLPLKPIRSSVSTSTTIWPLYVGLYSALEALLKAWPSPDQKQSTGARSLFSTCLRQIPDYIRAEEICLKEAMVRGTDGGADDSYGGTATDIYEELETSQGTCSQGWKPLREVVRAHGISIICDAILDGLFHEGFVKALVDLCASHNALDEGETLLKSLMTVNTFPRTPPSPTYALFDSRNSIAFSSLAAFAQLSGRRGFQYRLLTQLLRNRRLVPQWLATPDFTSLWDLVITSILQGDKDHTDAYQLLEAAISSSFKLAFLEDKPLSCSNNFGSYGASQSTEIHPPKSLLGSGSVTNEASIDPALDAALDKTVITLVEAVTAISILGNDVQNLSSRPYACEQTQIIFRLLNGITINIHRNVYQHGPDMFRNKYALKRMITIIFISILSYQGEAPHAPAYRAITLLAHLVDCEFKSKEFRSETHGWPQPVKELASSICSVARCCSRATRGDESTYIKGFVESMRLLVVSSSAMDHLSKREQEVFCGIFSVTVASLSPELGDDDYCEWLREIQSKYAGVEDALGMDDGQAGLTDHDSTKGGSAMEWEEDLCQRLANTPAISSRKRRKGSDASISSEGSLDYPIRPRRLDSQYPKLSLMLLGNSPGVSSPHATVVSPRKSFLPSIPHVIKHAKSLSDKGQDDPADVDVVDVFASHASSVSSRASSGARGSGSPPMRRPARIPARRVRQAESIQAGRDADHPRNSRVRPHARQFWNMDNRLSLSRVRRPEELDETDEEEDEGEDEEYRQASVLKARRMVGSESDHGMNGLRRGRDVGIHPLPLNRVVHDPPRRILEDVTNLPGFHGLSGHTSSVRETDDAKGIHAPPIMRRRPPSSSSSSQILARVRATDESSEDELCL